MTYFSHIVILTNICFYKNNDVLDVTYVHKKDNKLNAPPQEMAGREGV